MQQTTHSQNDLQLGGPDHLRDPDRGMGLGDGGGPLNPDDAESGRSCAQVDEGALCRRRDWQRLRLAAIVIDGSA